MSALRTPLHDWHVARGARMTEFGGWDMPVVYTSVVAEHQAVRTGAGLFDISHMGRLSFSGEEAQALIDRVFTNDVAGMKDFQVRYGLICNDQGGVRDDVLVYRWPYGWAMVVNAANRGKIVGVLEAERGRLKAQIMDQTTLTGMLAVQGPRAIEMTSGLFDVDPAALKYYHAAATRSRGLQCVVSRTGYSGEDGIEVMIGGAHVAALAEELVSRGAVPCGLGARDTLRLEAGMPLYGHELTDEIDPLQAGLGWAVQLDKGDFIGRDALLRRRDDPARPRRVGLVLDGTRSAREGCRVLLDGKAVGTVTSGAPAPTVGKPVAMAYVEPQAAAAGTKVAVDVRGKAESAQVVPLPFYKRPRPRVH
jgi:aminomethyltransferase